MKLIMMTDAAYDKMFKKEIMIQQMADLIVDIQNTNINYIKSRYEDPGLKTLKDLHKSINDSIQDQIAVNELIKDLDEATIKAMWQYTIGKLSIKDKL